MSKFRRYALFQLTVVGLTAVAVVSVYAVTGHGMAALAGFAVLALLGLRSAIAGGASPVQDERDEAIHQRAVVAGHVALWLALVAWGVAMPLTFAERGSVPLIWVAPVVWVAWWLVVCVRSVAILVLDRRGT